MSSILRYELHNLHLHHLLPCLCLLSLSFLITGCQNNKDDKPELDISKLPKYSDVARIQNIRVNKINSYWSRSSFEIKWYDQNQDQHKEIGEGHLMLIKPDRIALTFAKLGEIYSWAGCNSEMFWLFQGGDNPAVYVARNENAFTENCAELPISVHPLELLDLLGFFDFPDNDISNDQKTTPDQLLPQLCEIKPDENRGMWTVEIPARWSNRKIYLNPETLLPARIELKSRYKDEILVTADLSQYITMDVQGISLGNQPKVPSWVEINDLRSGTTLRLALRSPSDQTAHKGPIRDAVFDFDIIKRKMRPADYIILDKDSQSPAILPSN